MVRGNDLIPRVCPRIVASLVRRAFALGDRLVRSDVDLSTPLSGLCELVCECLFQQRRRASACSVCRCVCALKRGRT